MTAGIAGRMRPGDGPNSDIGPAILFASPERGVRYRVRLSLQAEAIAGARHDCPGIDGI